MTDIPIPSGPTNKQIVDRAWMAFGVSDAMFGRTEEEYAASILVLVGMMQDWPFDTLGYDASNPVAGERSGIAMRWLDAVALTLASRIAPAIGKQVSPDARRDQRAAYSRLCSTVGAASIPEAQYAPGTPVGAGHRWPSSGPFFPETT